MNKLWAMPDPHEELERTLTAILAQARASVAAGRDPNTAGLETRIGLAAQRARTEGIDPAGAQEEALSRLAQIAVVHRARARVAREPAPAAPVAPIRRPALLRTRPTITGTLDVRRGEGDGFRLVWHPNAAVSEWEVRLAERADERSDYVEVSSAMLGARETSVELPLGDKPFRAVIIGRGRGRVQRRAMVSGLTRESWRERWQRRASAS